jgi:type IX secretion system PorP/SprF family membrane protein
MYKFLTITTTLLLLITSVSAQQNSLFNTYSFDPLQLNIAYAGANCTEANVHYRNQWLGVNDAPKLLQLNAHMALSNNHALALRVNSQSQGLLNNLGAVVGYSFRIRVSQTAKLHLGLGFGATQTAFNAQRAVVIDGNDASLNNNNRQAANGFDSELGVMLVGKKLKAGVSALHLFNNNANFNGNTNYKILPQVNTQVSYALDAGRRLTIEPMLLDRYTVNGNNVVEGMVNATIAKTIIVGAGYRINYGVLALVGAKFNNIKLAYSFDYGSSKNGVNIGTSHQLLLGFSMCKKPKPTLPPQEPPVAVVPPAPPIEEPQIIKEEPKIEIKKAEEVQLIAPEVVAPKISIPVKIDAVEKLNTIASNVIFKLNKATLDAATLTYIDELAKVLKLNPTATVKIIGHTCNLGGNRVNIQLSNKRATYVQQQLIQRGVNAYNIKKIIGIGDENELFDNTTENQRKNRTIRFE